MKPLYSYSDYRFYLTDWLNAQNKRGMISRMAEALQVTPSMVSQVLKGDKHFTAEQGADLSDFMSLTEQESEYFHMLIEIGKAGTPNLRKRIQKRILKKRDEIRKISQIAPHEKELTADAKAEYYSSWLYTAFRNYIAVESELNLHHIARRLEIPLEQVQKVYEFLLNHHLIKITKNKLELGEAHIHVGADSPLVVSHHRNWRVKGLERMDHRLDSDLFFTSPMSLSFEAAEKVRSLLPQMIEQVFKIVGPSPSEDVRCLNIDWFRW